jgi:hypothetical protein
MQMLVAVEQYLPQFFSEFSAAWLTRDPHRDAAILQKFRQPLEMSALACPVYALKGNEFAAHQRRPVF